ncbi:hypothetical protein WBG78_28105 [Chryseolinea sp. T2]|uniref:hypothetical protein n=1 Tax=Chryseolinea sp. T2 TaxID=3129255 RepID=UPI003077B56A
MAPEGFTIFRSRLAAGRLLGERLATNLKGEIIVVTVSAGGFPVADSVAGIMHAVTVYLPTLYIPDPANPKKTIGAVNFGCAVTNDEGNELPGNYVYRQVQQLQQELKSNFVDQSAVFNKVLLNNQVVIVNDVVENAASVIAAIRLIRGYQPKLLTLATPVITVDAYMKIREEVDDIVALETVSPHMVAHAFNSDDYLEFIDEIPT